MKREELKKLGLTDEQIESVIASHGQTVQTLNSQIATLQQSETDLKAQVEKNNADLKKIQKDAGDNEELKQTIKDLQKDNAEQASKYEQSLIKVQRDSALNALLSDSKVKNVKAVAALLDDEKIKFEDGKLTGADDQIEALKKSDAYLFDLGTKPGGYTPAGGQSTDNYASFEEAMKAGDIDGFLKQQAESEENE